MMRLEQLKYERANRQLTLKESDELITLLLLEISNLELQLEDIENNPTEWNDLD